MKVQKIAAQSFNYPKKLQQLKKYPENIYVKGDLKPLLQQKSIAIIGSRTMSQYGKDVLYDLIPQFVNAGFVIVSGLAAGIDSTAQELALKSNGKTIGILGHGFNYLKRSNCYTLSKKMLNSGSGAVISPFENNVYPQKYTFVNRNHLIAALSDVVLVVEASKRSGTYHTVEAALELGKEVYAVPGSIFSYNSIGTNYLIKCGANLIQSIDDVLSKF